MIQITLYEEVERKENVTRKSGGRIYPPLQRDLVVNLCIITNQGSTARSFTKCDSTELNLPHL